MNKDDDFKICSSSADGSIFINSLSSPTNLTKLSLNESSVRTSIFSPMKSNEIGTGHDDGMVAVWD